MDTCAQCGLTALLGYHPRLNQSAKTGLRCRRNGAPVTRFGPALDKYLLHDVHRDRLVFHYSWNKPESLSGGAQEEHLGCLTVSKGRLGQSIPKPQDLRASFDTSSSLVCPASPVHYSSNREQSRLRTSSNLARAYGIPVGSLHSQARVKRYAVGLEEGAA